MSAPTNTEITAVVQRYATAWAANDVRAIFDCYHDDIVFHYFGRNPLAGTHRGKPACLAVLKQVGQKTKRKLVAIKDVMAGEHFGAVLAVERFEKEEGGESVVVERLLRYTVKDGKLAECWVYDEDQRLVDDWLA